MRTTETGLLILALLASWQIADAAPAAPPVCLTLAKEPQWQGAASTKLFFNRGSLRSDRVFWRGAAQLHVTEVADSHMNELFSAPITNNGRGKSIEIGDDGFLSLGADDRWTYYRVRNGEMLSSSSLPSALSDIRKGFLIDPKYIFVHSYDKYFLLEVRGGQLVVVDTGQALSLTVPEGARLRLAELEFDRVNATTYVTRSVDEIRVVRIAAGKFSPMSYPAESDENGIRPLIILEQRFLVHLTKSGLKVLDSRQLDSGFTAITNDDFNGNANFDFRDGSKVLASPTKWLYLYVAHEKVRVSEVAFGEEPMPANLIYGAWSAGVAPYLGYVATPEGLFSLRREPGNVSAVRRNLPTLSGTTISGSVFGTALFKAANGGRWYLREKEGQFEWEPVFAPPTSEKDASSYDAKGQRTFYFNENGVFYTIHKPWAEAKIDQINRSALEEAGPSTDTDRIIDFLVDHPCGGAISASNIAISVTDPGNKKTLLTGHAISKADTPQGHVVSARIRIGRPGKWTFQMFTQNPHNRASSQVGQPKSLEIASESMKELLERYLYWAGMGTVVLLVFLNITLFIMARWSHRAWRIVTGDGLVSTVLRVPFILLSHIGRVQAWVLDLYFQHRKRYWLGQNLSPFLPLPLTGKVSPPIASNEVVALPWNQRKIWIQGASGMGKTLLFRHVVQRHFGDIDNAPRALTQAGAVLVAFSARDFADGEPDRPDAAWVLQCIRSTLSRTGFTFEDEKLLRRMLESGTFAVAIDGVHEAGRKACIEQFARSFAMAPMLITSQEIPTAEFEVWRLPEDMRKFAFDLLGLHLTAGDAHAVMARMTASGLIEAVRSGYDIRLVIELVRHAPETASLPRDRVGLYTAIVEQCWIDVSAVEREEQLMRIAAAAWGMVSARQPHENTRRIVPGKDLDAALLSSLADAPEQAGRMVRLVRRVGNEYEFVHDQMHVYLAARWFARPDLRVAELEQQVAASTIWSHTVAARRALWSFVAALLDDTRLLALMAGVEDKEEWDVLRRDLLEEARRRDLPIQPGQPPAVV